MRIRVLLVATILTAASMAAPATAVDGGGQDRSNGVAAPAHNDVAPGYWTTSRRASAVDRDVLVRPAPSGKPDGAAKGSGGKGGGGKPSSGVITEGAAWTGGGLVQATLGKVYFTLGNTDYVCSGTVADSPSADLVLTAGHCVYDEATGYATNFVFVPDHDPDGASFGQWTATQLITTTGWQANDFEVDAAFAVIGEQTIGSIGQVVGTQGIAFNRPRGETMYGFGYPAARPYSGGDLIHCAGTVRNDPYGGTTQGMRCNMTGGSSGGGWFASFNPTTGEGLLNSLNSYKYSNDSSVMYGPYFGTTIQNLYASAEALAR